MAKTDKELAVELTCSWPKTIGLMASNPQVTHSQLKKDEIADLMAYFAEKLSKIN